MNRDRRDKLRSSENLDPLLDLNYVAPFLLYLIQNDMNNETINQIISHHFPGIEFMLFSDDVLLKSRSMRIQSREEIAENYAD